MKRLSRRVAFCFVSRVRLLVVLVPYNVRHVHIRSSCLPAGKKPSTPPDIPHPSRRRRGNTPICQPRASAFFSETPSRFERESSSHDRRRRRKLENFASIPLLHVPWIVHCSFVLFLSLLVCNRPQTMRRRLLNIRQT